MTATRQAHTRSNGIEKDTAEQPRHRVRDLEGAKNLG